MQTKLEDAEDHIRELERSGVAAKESLAASERATATAEASVSAGSQREAAVTSQLSAVQVPCFEPAKLLCQISFA